MLISPDSGPAAGSELRRTATVRAVEHARPSIVNIHGQKTVAPSDDGARRGDAPQHVNGMGTGIVIDERGYIITNHHVVEGVKKIQVTLAGGQSHTANLVSHDPRTDLAIIKITAKEPLACLTVGTSSDLMTGEPVIAVGNAFGYEHTVTRGIVSALHRTVQVSDAQQYRDLIQTSAPINPGNSGGPLLNIDGEMIGINVAVRAGAQGIGFAIPIDIAMSIAANLMSVERIESTYHGVHSPRQGEVPGEFVVGEIDDESPAAKGGLRAGDVVTKVGSLPVSRALDFERGLLEYKPGDEVAVAVERNHQSVTLNLVLTSKRRAGPSDQAWDLLGLKLEPVPSARFRQMQSRYQGGLNVQSVRPDSPAARQGIRRGDILVGMHIWETVSLENVAYVLNRADFVELEPLKFYILRNNEPLFGHLNVTMRK